MERFAGAGITEALDGVRDGWNALAEANGNPFMTAEWLSTWWDSFGHGQLVALVARDSDRSLRAAALLMRDARGRTAAPANDHSGSWDVLAADDPARAEMWNALASEPAARLVLAGLPDGDATAHAALERAGFRVVRERGPFSPFLELPATFEQLIAARSRNLRSQLGRRRRSLERAGRLVFRTTRGGDALARDLDAVLRVEASGWKMHAGTAILSDPRSVALYRRFAALAAERGWLRLRLLELDGEAIAADYSVVFGGGEFLLKTGFDERHARLSPGLVLRAEVLAAAIEEGLAFYDFLGGPDGYKLRWTDEIRPRMTLRGYRGAAALPAFAYRARVRPLLKAARTRFQSARRNADNASGMAGPTT